MHKGRLQSCVVCHDTFEQFHDDDEDAWMLRDCVHVANEYLHPSCERDRALSASSTISTPTTDADKPLVR